MNEIEKLDLIEERKQEGDLIRNLCEFFFFRMMKKFPQMYHFVPIIFQHRSA